MFVALTISPKPLDYDVNLLFQAYMNRYISYIKVKYILYPEMDLKGRLHFHGILERNEENIKAYNWTIKFLQNWCFICVKEITSMGNWIKYCKKEWKITKKLLRLKNPISNKLQNPINIFDYPEFKKIEQ